MKFFLLHPTAPLKKCFPLKCGNMPCSCIIRATIGLEPKIRTTGKNLILLPNKKAIVSVCTTKPDHTFAYLSSGIICFGNVLFSTSCNRHGNLFNLFLESLLQGYTAFMMSQNLNYKMFTIRQKWSVRLLDIAYLKLLCYRR